MFLLCVRWCDIDRVYKIFEILSPSAKVGSVIAEQDSILFFDGSSSMNAFAEETPGSLPE